jgi:hypothetical protein
LSAIVEAVPPIAPLYRVGRKPDPRVLPPHHVVGGNRFDDPLGDFRVLYAGETRLACFVETLAPLRPSVADIAALSASAGVTVRPPRQIPADWRRARRIARLRLLPGRRWLDLRAPETCEALRAELAALLLRLGMTDFDVSGARGPSRELTQRIARWAYDESFAGIAYRSRFDDRLDCWAIFEGAHIASVGAPTPIRRDNPELRIAAQRLGLVVV